MYPDDMVNFLHRSSNIPLSLCFNVSLKMFYLAVELEIRIANSEDLDQTAPSGAG